MKSRMGVNVGKYRFQTVQLERKPSPKNARRAAPKKPRAHAAAASKTANVALPCRLATTDCTSTSGAPGRRRCFERFCEAAAEPAPGAAGAARSDAEDCRSGDSGPGGS